MNYDEISFFRENLNYDTYLSRIRSHFDWYIRSAMEPEGEDKKWTIDEIREKLYLVSGIKPTRTTILRRNARFFQQYQCSPLRRVEYDKYIFDPIYYLIAGERVRPPQIGRGRPRKEYNDNEKKLLRDVYRVRNKHYARLRRRPERVLSKIFEKTSDADLDFISYKISEMADGIQYRKKTVESILKRYIRGVELGSIRGPPIYEISPGRYRRADI